VVVRLAALAGKVFRTTVQVKGLSLDPKTRQGTVWAELANPPGSEPKFQPGMAGRAYLTVLEDAAPPPALAALLDALSPEHVARDIRARLLLVHGRDDLAVPYTESLRLAAARPARTRVVLVGVLDHVDPARRVYAGVRDLLALWVTVYAMLSSV
jgi:fermentation-respiration switch protein FrsA (DUF1100 family)